MYLSHPVKRVAFYFTFIPTKILWPNRLKIFTTKLFLQN